MQCDAMVSIITSYYYQQLFYDNDWNMVKCPAICSSKIHLTIKIKYCQLVLAFKLHFSSCQKNPKDISTSIFFKSVT